MKPVHHAMVSAKLFGGRTEDYVDLHTTFDLSKSALGDMRHRAALHSVDHGSAVMGLIFPDRIGMAVRDALCRQHMQDDHGFDVTLDDWLRGADLPDWIRQRQGISTLAAFRDDPVQACMTTWGGETRDYADICAYYALPESVSDHPLAPAISRNCFSIFLSERIFGPFLKIVGKTGKERLVATRDIGEHITLAQFGRLPTLEAVLMHIQRQDWMLGTRVERSRRRRIAASGVTDLFDPE